MSDSDSDDGIEDTRPSRATARPPRPPRPSGVNRSAQQALSSGPSHRRTGQSSSSSRSSRTSSSSSSRSSRSSSSRSSSSSRLPFVLDLSVSEQDGADPKKDPAKLLRGNIVSILNKITPQNFKELSMKMMMQNIDCQEKLDLVVGIVFEKALSEPAFSETYANLCKVLCSIKLKDDPSPNQKVSPFRRALLDRCQEEFCRGKDVEEKMDKQIFDLMHNTEISEAERSAQKEELLYQRIKIKKKMLGNINFIGELLNLNLISPKIILCQCIPTLLEQKKKDSVLERIDDEKIECLSKLFTTAGQKLEKECKTEEKKKLFEQLFSTYSKLQSDKNYPYRIRCMIQDVMDLRSNGWTPQRQEIAALKASEVKYQQQVSNLKADLRKQELKISNLTADVNHYKVLYENACNESDEHDSDQELDAKINQDLSSVMIVRNSTKASKEPPPGNGWYYGRIQSQIQFIKPLEVLPKKFVDKDVFMFDDTLDGAKLLFPLKKGDRVRFELSTKNDKAPDERIKPKAHKVIVDSFEGQRSLEEVRNYFEFLVEKVSDGGTRSETMNTIMTCHALWDYLLQAKTNPITEYESYVRCFYTFLMTVFPHMGPFPTQKTKIMVTLMSVKMMNAVTDLKDRSRIQIWQMESLVECDQSRLKDCLQYLGEIVKSNGTKEAKFLHRMLLKTARLVDLEKWQELTPIPSIQEMFGDPLEKVCYLKPIVIGKPYDSVDQYLNINYRLLRAECFSSIQKGIVDFNEGHLDPRDMSMYSHVSVVDVVLDGSRSVFYLRFKPDRRVDNWNKSKKLMFGNLLCATAKGDFSDAIWLTVIDRDPKKLHSGPLIGVELTTFSSDSSVVDSALALFKSSGRIIMAESPTYFQSFRHVLESLRNSALQSFELCEEILQGKDGRKLPLSVSSKIYREIGYGSLEDSQKEAFDHALTSPLTIIQGPPGTGKTFVGAKLAQLFYLLEEERIPPRQTAKKSDLPVKEPPILVLTYKNHALDEFLKHCLDFCPKEYLLRLGGQSKEPELAECVMRERMKNTKFFRVSSRDIMFELGAEFARFKGLRAKFKMKSIFNIESFCEMISEEQLKKCMESASKGKQASKIFHKLQGKNMKSIILHSLKNRSKTELDWFVPQFRAKFQQWLPGKAQLVKLATLYSTAVQDGSDDDDCTPGTSEEVEQGDKDEDDIDEDYLNEQLAQRESAYDDLSVREQAKANMTNYLLDLSKLQSSSRPNEFHISDFPQGFILKSGLLNTKDIFSLSEVDRYSFIYATLTTALEEVVEKMKDVLENFHILQRKKNDINEENKLKLLNQQKIVGATIVGASIQLSLLQKLNPKIVIIEECAEIMEPCLTAILTKSVERLIMIGDHQQLRPQVDTYFLKKHYHLDVSMMERLIKCGLPYKSLLRQGRMRPEFSRLLLDIYPDYKDFPDLDRKNPKIGCLSHSMFWWTHQYPEQKERTVKNVPEAGMAVSLALYMIGSHIPPEKITIICGYLGQVHAVRTLFRSLYPTTPGTPSVDIRSIDEYQGDENDYVIISLTRSNRENQIGFMKEIERRCVAQSRAKCGLYFVGNVECFEKHKTWSPIISELKTKGLIGSTLSLCCYVHPALSVEVSHVMNLEKELKGKCSKPSEITYYLKNASSWCKVPCKQLFSCKIEDHRCKKLCTPRHTHEKCETLVDHTFPVCKHQTSHHCYEDPAKLKCGVKLVKNLPKCGHEKEITCDQWLNNPTGIMCLETCEEYYGCSEKHKCEKLCGKAHSHNITDCPIQVNFTIDSCGHEAHFKKVCSLPKPTDVKCRFQMIYNSPVCGHPQRRKCSDPEDCKHQCSRRRPDCGHPCQSKCVESCLLYDCEICVIEYQKVVKKMKEIAKKEYVKAKEAAVKMGDSITLVKVDENARGRGRSHLEDKCRFFLNQCEKISLEEVKSIYKVNCPKNSEEFWDSAANKSNGFLQEELFKVLRIPLGSDDLNDLPCLMKQLANVAGTSFDFTKGAIDSDIPANHCDNLTIVIGDLLIGDMVRMEDVKGGKRKFMTDNKKDSILVSKMGEPAKYRVYDRSLFHIKYLVNLQLGEKKSVIQESEIFANFQEGETRFKLADMDLRNVSDPIVDLIGKAISLYNGACSKRPAYNSSRAQNLTVMHVGIVNNQRCAEDYSKRKSKIKDPYEIFAYHATDKGNIESIIKTNLDPNRKAVHGRRYGDGCYFSEHPEFSAKYGQECMIIFKLLLIEGQFTKVQPDGTGFCQQLVLKDAALFKPVFVLWFIDDPPGC